MSKPPRTSIYAWATRVTNVKGWRAKARGDAARDLRDWPAAAEHYSLHLNTKPTNGAIWVQLGHAHKESGRLDDAFAAYEEALRLDGQDADLLFHMGHLQKRRGNREAAIALYRRSAALSAETSAVLELNRLGVHLHAEGQPAPHGATESKAETPSGGFNRLGALVRRLAAGRGKVALARGDRARDQRNWNAAIDHYQLHLLARPEHFAIWVQLGHALKEAARFDEALTAYERAHWLNGDDADLLLSFGHLQKLLGRRENAIYFYQRSAAAGGGSAANTELVRLGVRAKSAPRHPMAQGAAGSTTNTQHAASPLPGLQFLTRDAARRALIRGDAARDRRDWMTAIEHYRLHLRSRPTNFGIWVQLGHALKEAGKANEAQLAYEQAFRLNTHDADLLLSLGHLKKRMGCLEEAISFYRRSVELDAASTAAVELTHLGVLPIR